MATFNNRDKFLSKLLEIYTKLNWERNGQELKTYIGGNGEINSATLIRCDSTRDGTFLQIIPAGKAIGPCVDAKDDKRVEEIRDKVWNFINHKTEDEWWGKALNELNNVQ